MGEEPLLHSGSVTVVSSAEQLPIGEVLALLQDEFPDVTISKIRFLESQGLIQPERTASGYRRFSIGDIERLQWILRQQRDHFLPLKIIRKMLDDGVDRYDPGGGPQPTLFSSAVEADAEADDADDADEARDDDGDDVDGQESVESQPTPWSRAHPAVASAPQRPSPPRPAERPPVASQSESSASRQPASASDSAADASSVDGDAAGDDRPPHETPADVVAALQEDPRPRRSEPSRSRGEDRPVRRRPPLDAASAETSLSTQELCAAAGIDDELLVELERFGLVQATVRSGDRVYGPSALDVSRLAVRYRELGVEPRHLRMYLVAAEREAGLVEQLAVPILKQRNPDARQHASDLALELADLGSEMHRTLLRRELGHDLLA